MIYSIDTANRHVTVTGLQAAKLAAVEYGINTKGISTHTPNQGENYREVWHDGVPVWSHHGTPSGALAGYLWHLIERIEAERCGRDISL